MRNRWWEEFARCALCCHPRLGSMLAEQQTGGADELADAIANGRVIKQGAGNSAV